MLNFHMWFLKSIAFQICETLFFHIKKGFVLDFRKYCRFSYAGTWELVNLFVGTKNVRYHICYENIGQKTEKYSEVKRQTDHGQTELNNVLVKKNALNEINKEGAFTQDFNHCRKIKRKVSQNLDNLQNLLIKLANC